MNDTDYAEKETNTIHQYLTQICLLFYDSCNILPLYIVLCYETKTNKLSAARPIKQSSAFSFVFFKSN